MRDSSAICPPAAQGLGVWPLSTRTGDSQSHAPTCVGAAAHRVEKVPDSEKVTTSDFFVPVIKYDLFCLALGFSHSEIYFFPNSIL